MRALDIGVVGCGTAGSAAAIFLARAGHRVTVYERVEAPTAVGAGITIQPTGLHVLSRLGIHEHVVSRGARIERLTCETASRKLLVDLSYAEIAEDLFGVGLHRGVLFDALYKTLARERVVVRTGIEIHHRQRASSKRTWLVDTRGELHGPHELVVVADGARSKLRDHTGHNVRAEPYPWGALWYVAKDTRGDARHAATIRQVTDSNHTLFGLLPTGYGPGATWSSLTGGPSPLVSLFWSIRASDVAAFRLQGLHPWKERVLRLAPEAEPLLDQIADVDQLLFAAYHDVVMHRWATRSTVYLGDAAHATSPQLGQGSNLALWDAMVLSDCLEAETRDLPHALDCFSRARRDHLAFYQLSTRWLTHFFQGDIALFGMLRDLFMPAMQRVTPFRRLMTLAMLGVVDGFSGRTLTLRLPIASS